MASFVVKHKNLNIKNITFSDIKQTKMGGSNIYIRYKNPANTSQEHNLYVQTPKMFCPFGASAFKQTDNSQLPRYNLNLSFGKDKPELKKFQDKLQALDELVLEKVINDKKLLALLNVTGSKDKIRAGLSFLQIPTIKFPKDDTKDYPPNLSVKIPTVYSTGKISTDFYNKQKEKMEVNHDNMEMCCPKKSEVKCLLRIASIWFVGGKFGIALRAEQVIVFPSQSLSGYAFADDSGDEEEVDEQVSSALKSGVVLSDTEDEEEVEVEEVEEVEVEVEVEEVEEVEEEGPVLSEDSEEEVEVVPEPPKPKRGRRKATRSRKKT